jgi:Tol biopolymer transport system component
MSLQPGTRLGSYEITAAIGAGGMGEVYRARDTKLDRDVAIKVLPDLFAADPERLKRFEREAKTLASLNHPNIAQVHGVIEQPPALVMELVDGEDFAARLARGPLPLDEAIPIARQVAEALEAAHERGIVHRDLKPANIKVRDDGTVKVLDFGLAKLHGPAEAGRHDSGTAVMNSPTFTSPAMTQMGMILGTAAYMAPEQAKGRAVDRRADVWAFGCLLYEMLTGRRAFRGDDVTDTLAAVIRGEPDWSALPADTPASLRRLLRRSLEKDPKQRLSSMSDARLDLEEREESGAALPPAIQVDTRRRAVPLVAAALAGAALTTGVFLAIGPWSQSAADRSPVRLSVLPPPGVSFAFDSAEVALSPDGRTLAFTTGVTGAAQAYLGATRIWVRPLDSVEARALPGTEGGWLPFWSPDGRELAFFSEDKLKKVSIAGGNPQILADAKDGRGGAWSPEGIILFAPSNNGPLFRVSANGGEARAATALDSAAGETGHRFPIFLPDGRHFLFVALPPKNSNFRFQIYAASLDFAERSPLLEAESRPAYAEPGYLLSSRKNILVAQPFDAERRVLSGEAQALPDALSSVGGLWSGAPGVTVAASGTLAFLGGPRANTKLVWFDRSGKEGSAIQVPSGQYNRISISPDGRRAAVVRATSTVDQDVWLVELERSGASRFTYGGSISSDPTWSPDGRRLAYSSDRGGPRNIYVRDSSGASPEQLLFESPGLFKEPTSWSADGRWLVMQQLDAKTNGDIWLVPLDGERTAKPYLQSPFNEVSGSISPDGRWIAYASDESGRYEIYVQSFPTPGSKHQVTSGGSGTWVRWRKDGKELAMMDGEDRGLLVADVRAAGEFDAGPPRLVLTLPKNRLGMDLTSDFQRVLATVPVDETATSSITVVTNWLAALKKN